MSKKPRNYTKIDSHNFAAVKKLIEVGLSGREIQRAMGIAPATYSRIKNSESLEDYRYIVNHKNAQKKEEEKSEPKVEYVNMNWEANISPKLTIIIELLQTINRKLGPEPQQEEPKKRGLFH
jgi:hypothetical protein